MHGSFSRRRRCNDTMLLCPNQITEYTNCPPGLGSGFDWFGQQARFSRKPAQLQKPAMSTPSSAGDTCTQTPWSAKHPLALEAPAEILVGGIIERQAMWALQKSKQ
eukprot:1161061-Pelagomonas_calceolata.AAC.3